MSSSFMDSVSISFAMKLYRKKILAEKRKDKKTLEYLKQHYPDIFTDEFNEMIEKSKLVLASLDQENGENFSRIFDPNYTDDSDIIH